MLKISGRHFEGEVKRFRSLSVERGIRWDAAVIYAYVAGRQNGVGGKARDPLPNSEPSCPC